MKNIHSPNWVGIGSWGPEIWLHEYLISPIEISVNWSGSKQLWTRPISLISVGLIRYSCGHISGHHEPIYVKFGVWGFFIMFYWNIVMKMLKCNKENLMTSHFSTLWCYLVSRICGIDELMCTDIAYQWSCWGGVFQWHLMTYH